MFEQTRRKLTLMYSGMLALILATVFVGFYLLLSAIIDQNVRERLEIAAEKAVHEWNEHQHWLPMNPGEDRRKFEFVFLQPNQFAIFVPEDHEEIVSASLLPRGSMEAIQNEVLNHSPEMDDDQVTHISIATDEGVRVYAVYQEESDDVRAFLGEEITEWVQLLHQMKWVLLAVGAILFFLSTLIGYWFSGRAMVPINLSFQRQREFTSDASHELRTPLSVILSSAEILQEKKDSLPAFHQMVLHNMLDEIHRMIRLVEHLLTLSRSDVEENPKQFFQTFDMRAVVREVLERIQMVASAKGVSVVNLNEQESDPIPCYGDIDLICQLLYILLDNGVKYSETGGTVEIEVRKTGNNRVTCTVHDYGCGIPEEDLPYIFERFYRADKARSRLIEGTGLGLSIAAQIVKIHKGHISATSSKEQGTVFTFVLPIVQPRGE